MISPWTWSSSRLIFDNSQDLKQQYGVNRQTTIVAVDAAGNEISSFNAAGNEMLAVLIAEFVLMSYPFNSIEGVNDNQTIKVVIEIPKHSSHKVEWDRKKGYFVLDRIEPGIFAKPVNYGFIPQTLDQDDDELDALIVTDEPLPFGVVVPEARVLGRPEFYRRR